MKTKTFKNTQLHVSKLTLSQHLKDAFIDVLNDCSDIEDFHMQVAECERCARNLLDKKTRYSFQLGYTSMFLPSEEMLFVENFFSELRKNPGSSDQLEIVITDENGIYDTVPMDFIQY